MNISDIVRVYVCKLRVYTMYMLVRVSVINDQRSSPLACPSLWSHVKVDRIVSSSVFLSVWLAQLAGLSSVQRSAMHETGALLVEVGSGAE